MTFSALTYAKAFTEVLAVAPKGEPRSGEAEREIRKRFLAVVKKHGDTASLPKILREIIRLTDEREGVHRVEVASARPLADRALQSIRVALGKGDVLKPVVVPALVAGVRITVDGEHVIDASLAGRVKKLFS